jgi:5,10-methylene-tetrahydrofolate dehydrogenase/methenyl tetrahydrofolate cyclohydrolase
MMYGKPVAEQIEGRIIAALPDFINRFKTVPRLAIVQVGQNPASNRYIARKIEACARIGMRADLFNFSDEISADALREEVSRLSRTSDIHGILVQLPLPPDIEEPENGGINKFDIFDAISPDKDVDGVGHESIATLYRAQQDRMKFLACTALAVRRMMSFYGVQTEGRLAVTIGRNDITAKPIMHMLGGRMCNAAAVWCHRYVSSEDQQRLMRQADIIVTSVGSEHFRITRGMVKPGVVVFDIATRVTSEGKLAGDVDRDVAEIASLMTPVPRGVGPVTVAALTENLFRAAQFCVGAAEPGYTF